MYKRDGEKKGVMRWGVNWFMILQPVNIGFGIYLTFLQDFLDMAGRVGEGYSEYAWSLEWVRLVISQIFFKVHM